MSDHTPCTFKGRRVDVIARIHTVSVSVPDEPVNADRRWVIYYAVIACVTLLAFSPVFENGFTNWDDNVYVTENILIHSLSWHNILRIFSPTTFVSLDYHPITIISYALNYAAGKLNPTGYILADILIHLLNVLLVFIFIRKISGSDFAASLCALLFGIHPMHVESVAWISGRKDLLNTLFYLASALLYVSYLEKRTGFAILRYSGACFLFACSLLSKATTVTLPVVLFLIDYYRERRFSIRMVIDKVPFIVLSIVLGLWAIAGQHGGEALLDGYGRVPVFTRIAIACYSFMFYVVKFFVPTGLSALYPYPDSFSTSLHLRYSLSPLFTVAAGGLALYLRRSKAFVFGFGFFLINVIFILHFIPASTFAVTADRFSYCASIGLSFIVANYVEQGIASLRLKSVRRGVSAALLCCITLVFGYAVRDRCTVWKNSETLWTDVIGKYPSSMAYDKRGHVYYLKHDFARALEDYNMGLLHDPSDAFLYYDRGLLYDVSGDHARAVKDYDRAIAHKPGLAEAYNNRGFDYYVNGDYVRAIHDFERAISLNPALARAYYNRANVLKSTGDYHGAMADYSRAVSLNPNYADAWYNQGRAYQAMDDLDRAIASFTRTLEIDTAYAQAWNDRGVIYGLKGDFDRAIVDFNRAIYLQPSSPNAYINRGNAYGSKGGYPQAINDYSRAISLDPAKYPQVFFYRGLAYRANGDLEHAREDIMRACAMHVNDACRELQKK